MHFWIDKRSQTGINGRQRIPASISAAGRRRRQRNHKPMVTPIHRLQVPVAHHYRNPNIRRPPYGARQPSAQQCITSISSSQSQAVTGIDTGVYIDTQPEPVSNQQSRTEQLQCSSSSPVRGCIGVSVVMVAAWTLFMQYIQSVNLSEKRFEETILTFIASMTILACLMAYFCFQGCKQNCPTECVANEITEGSGNDPPRRKRESMWTPLSLSVVGLNIVFVISIYVESYGPESNSDYKRQALGVKFVMWISGLALIFLVHCIKVTCKKLTSDPGENHSVPPSNPTAAQSEAQENRSEQKPTPLSIYLFFTICISTIILVNVDFKELDRLNTKYQILLATLILWLFALGIILLCFCQSNNKYKCQRNQAQSSAAPTAIQQDVELQVVQQPSEEVFLVVHANSTHPTEPEQPPPPYHLAILLPPKETRPPQLDEEELPPPPYDKAVT